MTGLTVSGQLVVFVSEPLLCFSKIFQSDYLSVMIYTVNLKTTTESQAIIWPMQYNLCASTCGVLSLHFVIWILRLIKSMIELIDFMMQHFLPDVTLNMLFSHI